MKLNMSSYLHLVLYVSVFYLGHEVFSSVGEGEAEKEQAAFKQHVEQIQLNLTSASLQGQTNGAGMYSDVSQFASNNFIKSQILVFHKV